MLFHIKTAAFLCAAALAAAALTACSQNGNATVSQASATSATSAATEPGSTAASSAAATESTAATTTQPPERHAEDYVETVQEYEIPIGGKFFLTGEEAGDSKRSVARLPQLKLDSDDARAVNSEIHEKHDRTFESYTSGGTIFVRTDYVCALNGNTLSLAIESRSTDSPNSGFSVYNFNVDTGALLTDEEVVALAGISMEDAHAALAADINAICDDGLTRITNDKLVPQLEDVRTKSLEEDNLNRAQYFFDSAGRLNAAYRYYWIAGQGDNGTLLVTDYHFAA